jgi:hypothetical protein
VDEAATYGRFRSSDTRIGSALQQQADLFADQPTAAPQRRFEPSAEFVERVRAELQATLAEARAAKLLPWGDLTKATLVELRFKSIMRWLPEDEAATLWSAFDAELERLYAAEDAARGYT